MPSYKQPLPQMQAALMQLCAAQEALRAQQQLAALIETEAARSVSRDQKAGSQQ